MILLDFSQVAIGNLHQQLKHYQPAPLPGRHGEIRDPYVDPFADRFGDDEKIAPDALDTNLLRHMILNSIRKHNRQFTKEYGQMVICTDNSQYWRKTFFKFYKANRKKDRLASDIDWNLVFTTLNTLREELRDNFPYKVINVHMAEADDVIGVVAKNFHALEKILIVSGDKDFLQLQVYPGVKQFAPVQDKFLTTADPILFLKEHIIRGDVGDGIPNFLSDDDVLVTEGVRQTSVYKAKLDVWLNQKPEEFCDKRTLANYHRNEKLVDLNQVPETIENAIIEEFQKPIVGSRDKIFGYLVKHRMKNLLGLIRDF